MLLLNLRSKSVVHIFAGVGARITALAPSPVLDVVAVGTRDGRVVLHNVRVDEAVCTLLHGRDWGEGEGGGEDFSIDVDSATATGVSVLTFCTDGSETLVSGDAAGNLAVWDLGTQALLALARGVHVGGTALAQFLPGEPLLVTGGVLDNSVKVHIFDGPTRCARVLRSREGHSAPPTRVRFSGSGARMLVSAGLDREVRIVSAVRDSQNRSFSQAGLKRESAKVRKRRRAASGIEKGASAQRAGIAMKLPVVTGIATCTARTRDGDFANVVTTHAFTREAYTWRMQTGAVHGHVLSPPPPPRPMKLAFKKNGKEKPGAVEVKRDSNAFRSAGRPVASAAVISYCGNFAFVGLSTGEVHGYNMQSGRHQGTFVADDDFRSALQRPSAPLETWGAAHKTEITGLAVDACGEVLISCGGSEMRFWNMHTREPIGQKVIVPARVMSMVWSKASELVAVACEDFGVYVYDAGTRKLARRLVEHKGVVTDICFDSAGRRIVTSSMDGTLKTWDLPSGRAIDTLHCETAPTSVAVAPGGEFIATCHVNSLSITLWVDQTKFGVMPRNLRLTANAGNVAGRMHGSDSEDGSSSDSDGNGEGEIEHRDDVEGAIKNLGSDLITLSGMATTKWTTLANLDAIKRRNKPLQPPKKPESVPFFLPTVKAVKPKFDIQAAAAAAWNSGGEDSEGEGGVGQTHAETGKSRVNAVSREVALGEDDFFGNSQFGSLCASKNFTAASTLMSKAGPSTVDVEIRTLEGPSSRLGAAQYFLSKLRARRDFELNQAQLDVFLKAHGIALMEDDGGQNVLRELLEAQNETWALLRNSFDSVLTLSSHFSGQI